jgi:hypothetical protein
VCLMAFTYILYSKRKWSMMTAGQIWKLERNVFGVY